MRVCLMLLFRMWYSGFIEAITTREERCGYPHNGGAHTLELHMTPDDVKAFVEAAFERFDLDLPEGVDALKQKLEDNLKHLGLK